MKTSPQARYCAGGVTDSNGLRRPAASRVGPRVLLNLSGIGEAEKATQNAQFKLNLLLFCNCLLVPEVGAWAEFAVRTIRSEGRRDKIILSPFETTKHIRCWRNTLLQVWTKRRNCDGELFGGFQVDVLE